MEHYQLGEVKVIVPPMFEDVGLSENVVIMKVLLHSMMKNLLGFAINKMKQDDVQHLVWYGEASCCQKAQNCAEIMKRKSKNLWMLTRKSTKRVEEYWDPIYILELDRLKVNKDTEVSMTLLSKQSLEEFSYEDGYLSQTQIPASVSYPGHDSTNTAKKDGQAPNRSRRRNNNSKQQTLTTPLLEQPTGMPQKSPRKLQSHTKKNVSTCNEKAGRAMS